LSIGPFIVLIPFFIVALLDATMTARYARGQVLESKSAAGNPPVSVIVAAYNAQDTIADTVRSIVDCGLGLESEIIIVDDGSTDNTPRALRGLDDKRMLVVHEKHRGKWSALNKGVSLARHERVVMVDADTIVERGSVQLLASRLEGCDAVAGNLIVKSEGPLLVSIQAQEHIRISMYRRADMSVDTVSGAFAAFRNEILEKVPFNDSIVEDFEHTARMRKEGAKICYEPGARAHTSMPNTLREYLEQRVRWARGTFSDMGRMGMPLKGLARGYFISILDVSVVPLALIFGRWDALASLFLVEAFVQSYGAYKEGAGLSLGSVLFLPILVFLALMHLLLGLDATIKGYDSNDNLSPYL